MKLPRKHRKIVLLMVFLLLGFSSRSTLFALPEGNEVISGEATFVKVNNNTLNVTASSNSIINYQSFNIAQNETVNVILPNVDSFLLNRVIGSNPTEIYGSLIANGNLVLVNPNGILFGPTANLAVGGLIASTRDITNQNFLNGQYLFGNTDQSIHQAYSSIVNQGSIQTRDGGFAVLIGSSVANEGIITAPLGHASLASGDVVTVGVNPGGSISIGIDEPVSHEVLDAEGKPISDQVKQSGEIRANTVSLNAKAAENIFQLAVNQTGIIRAERVVEKDGVIEILGSGPAEVSGTLEANHVTVESDKILAIPHEINTRGETTFKAKDDMRVDANVKTVSGDLTFQADSDMNGAGSFLQAQGTTLKTTVSSPNAVIPERFYRESRTYGSPTLSEKNVRFFPKSAPRIGASVKAFGDDNNGNDSGGDITIQSSGESTLANIESQGSLILKQAGLPVTYTQHPDSVIHIKGSLRVNEGVTLKASNAQYSIYQDWVNLGNFIPQASIVRLMGPEDSKVLGNNTFHDFLVIEPSKKVSFESGATQEIEGTLTLQGGYGKLLLLRSTNNSIPWKINSRGTSDIQFTLVQNSDNVNIHGPPLTPLHSKNSIGNTDWDFSQTGPVWTNSNHTNLWSDPLNWDGGFIPGSGDIVKMSSPNAAEQHCGKTACVLIGDPDLRFPITDFGNDSIVDLAFPGTIAGLILESSYTGTLTLGRDLTVLNDVTLKGGVFDVKSERLVVGGAFTVTDNGHFRMAILNTLSVRGEFTAPDSNFEIYIDPTAFGFDPSAVEIPGLRTAMSLVFLVGPNQYAAVSSGQALFRYNEEGTLIPVEAFGRRFGNQFVFRRLPDGMQVTFDLTHPSYTLSQGDYHYTVAFNTAGEGVVESGDIVVYRMSDNTILRWKVSGSNVVKNIDIENDGPLPNLSFKILTSENLHTLLENNQILFKNAQDETVFLTQAPTLMDMGLNPILDHPVTLADLGNHTYDYRYSSEGLNYPYILDPTSGPNFPSTAVNDAGVGTIAWTNPGNVTASDNTRATASIGFGAVTNYIKATGFGFSIATGSTIDGILVEWEVSVAANNFIKDSAARIVQGGTIGSTDKSSGTLWTTTDTFLSHGSSSDLWGLSWAAADINATTFGAALAATMEVMVAPQTGQVDSVRITVTFTAAATATTPPPDPCRSADCNPPPSKPPTGGSGGTGESSSTLETSGNERSSDNGQENKSVSDDDECSNPWAAFSNSKCAARTKTKVIVREGTVYVLDRGGRLIAIVEKGMKIEIEWGHQGVVSGRK